MTTVTFTCQIATTAESRSPARRHPTDVLRVRKNHRCYWLRQDSLTHGLLQDIGVSPNDFNHPAGVAVYGDGVVYVADWTTERALIFDDEGKTLSTLREDSYDISKWARIGLNANPDMSTWHCLLKNPEVKQTFRMPSYCDHDQETNRLMLSDTMGHRILISQKEEGYQDSRFDL